jgi:serine/threonine protein kinase
MIGSDDQIRIVDFGISTKYETKKKTSEEGTYRFMAPEVFDKKHGKECDIWSLGVTLYNLITAEYPFH